MLNLTTLNKNHTKISYFVTESDLGLVAEWSKVLIAVPWPLMLWFTLALGTYQLRFVSWVFHVIFSFVHFISLYTMGGLRAFRKPLPYNMYLFNLWIANHILIKIKTSSYHKIYYEMYFTWSRLLEQNLMTHNKKTNKKNKQKDPYIIIKT